MRKRIRQFVILARALLFAPKKALLSVITASENEKEEYLRKKYGKTRLPSIDLLDLFPSFDETITHYSFLEGTSLPTDIALLKMLARSYQDCTYLEIGTWRGESIINVFEVTKSCDSVDLPAAELKIRGASDKVISNQDFFIKDLEGIRKIRVNSMDFDFNSLKKKYDLIFVDGDHHYLSVKSDTENVHRLLKDDASVIVWHDYATSPERVRHEVLAGILDGLPADEHKNLYHVSNTLCAFFSRKKFATREIEFPETPDKEFTIHLKAGRL
jgi:predicted O-methyltransferase YrrM